MYRQVFPPGTAIFREGEIGDSAYVIERGSVEISALRRGRNVPVARLETGDLFGEMALVDDQVRMATATAIDETEVVVVSRDRIREEVERAGPIVDLILRVVLERMRSTHGMMLRYRLGLQTGEIRVPGLTESGNIVQPGPEYVETRQRAIEEIRLEEEIRRGHEESQFELFLQPIVHLADGATAGFESLIRWRHPERGLVSPGRFIGVAESSGLIVPIGLWALEQGAELLARMARDLPGGEHFLNINVSARQLAEPGLIEALPEVIERHGLEPGRLKLELTESLLVEDPDVAVVALQRLRDTGVGIVLDDFGTGYSSLGYLNRFPIDTIKIDRSFVSTLEKQRVSLHIVRAVTSLANALHLEVVAEGVETDRQRELLVECGCRFGQGYLFSRPLEVESALRALASGEGEGGER